MGEVSLPAFIPNVVKFQVWMGIHHPIQKQSKMFPLFRGENLSERYPFETCVCSMINILIREGWLKESTW